MREAILPFPIDIPQAELDDLADRLARTRCPDAGTVQDGSQGPQLNRIRALPRGGLSPNARHPAPPARPAFRVPVSERATQRFKLASPVSAGKLPAIYCASLLDI